MQKFKSNTYIELFNPATNYYFPIRILENTQNGYKAIILENNKRINVFDYQLKTYGYKNIRINEKILNELGFEKDGLEYRLNDFLLFEGLIGDLKSVDHPFYLFEFNSRHLGFAILNKDELKDFKLNYDKINFNEMEHTIKNKYTFTSNVNDVFSKLIEDNSNEYDYDLFDKIIVKNK